MKQIVTLAFFALTLFAKAQETTYYDSDWNETGSLNTASYYTIVSKDASDSNKVHASSFYKSGQIKIDKYYSDYKNGKLDGKYKEWYSDGKPRKEIDYKDGKLNGLLLTYWDNGQPKRIDNYENDKFIDGKCMNSDGIESIHYNYMKMAEFPGGVDELMQYLVKELKYPKSCRRKGIEGRVLVRFIVNKNGSIGDIKIIQGVNEEMDAEAVRVVSNMPKWEPGVEDGEAVKVSFNLPVKFRLE